MRSAVIIPCLNEEETIAAVVRDVRIALPVAEIFVFDNGSDDQTKERARSAGAEVIHSPLRGKGNALRHAFRILNFDYYIMVDGDGTYPMSEAPKLLKLAQDFNYEMVVGTRLKNGKPEAFRPFHYMGNRLFTFLVCRLFQFPVQDLLSGYRVFSRRFAEEVHLTSRGFEVETEITLRAIIQDMAFLEVPIDYGQRPPESHSKLRTFRDGWKILKMILRSFFVFKPLKAMALSAVACLVLALKIPAASLFFTINAALFLALGIFFEVQLAQIRWQRVSSSDGHTSGSSRKAA